MRHGFLGPIAKPALWFGGGVSPQIDQSRNQRSPAFSLKPRTTMQTHPPKTLARAQGFSHVSDEAAGTIAGILTVLRGPGAPYTTPAECKHCTAVLLADMNEVPPEPDHNVSHQHYTLNLPPLHTSPAQQGAPAACRTTRLTCRRRHVQLQQLFLVATRGSSTQHTITTFKQLPNRCKLGANTVIDVFDCAECKHRSCCAACAPCCGPAASVRGAPCITS